MKNLKNYFRFLPMLALLAVLAGCVKEDFDMPPPNGENPDLVATHTISQLKDSIVPGQFVELSSDIIISGIIVADDRSGNFYQELVIQDETGGINVTIAAADMFNTMPIGRRIFVRCNGLVITDDAGLPKIGGGIDPNDGDPRLARIAAQLMAQHIVPGEYGLEVTPKDVTIGELTPADYSTLIRLTDVQFREEYAGETYANAELQQSINTIVEDCNGASIILRNSGFADFAGEVTPEGNGTLVAVFSVFLSDRQLFIRNTADVDMTGARCGEGGDPPTNITIAEVRDLYSNGSSSAPASTSIKGVVISDEANGNFNSQNIVVQDATAGIVVRFENDHNFNLNEEVEINISGMELSDFNGLVQINNVPGSRATSLGSTSSPAPRTATVEEILANAGAWESTLVEIENASFSGGATFGDGPTVSDGTGTIPTFTFFSASFSDNAVPSSATTVVAIIGNFDGAQLNFRNADDIGSGGGGGGDPVLTDLTAIRNLFTGSTTSIPADIKVQGIVISDVTNMNTHPQNLVLQDASGAGVVIRFTDVHNYAMGTELEIIISGQELSEFNGLLQVNNVPQSNVTDMGAAPMPTPTVITVADLLSQAETLESTLVTLEGVTISGNTVYDGNTTVTDGTGSIPMFTRGDATFSNTSVPAGTVDLTGIVSEFNDPQVYIRNLDDVN